MNEVYGILFSQIQLNTHLKVVTAMSGHFSKKL